MELLEENNVTHLLSLINVEMNPLRRRREGASFCPGRGEEGKLPEP